MEPKDPPILTHEERTEVLEEQVAYILNLVSQVEAAMAQAQSNPMLSKMMKMFGVGK